MRPRGRGPAVRAAAARRCLRGQTRGGRCNCIPRLAGPWPSISLIDGRPNMFGVLMMFTVITISLWMGHQTRQHTPARESPGFTLPAPAPAVTVARTQAGPAPAPALLHLQRRKNYQRSVPIQISTFVFRSRARRPTGHNTGTALT